jgi:hypothetical protein
VAAVVVLIVMTSTIGIINPLWSMRSRGRSRWVHVAR